MLVIPARALLFDVVGTVVDWRGGLIKRLDSWAAERGVVAPSPSVVDSWRAASPAQWAQVNSGERAWINFDKLLRESLGVVVQRLGLPAFDDAASSDLVDMWRKLPPWPDGLRRLRQHYAIAPLSNGNVAYLIDLARTAGLTWDAVFGADIFRRYKPAAETYLGAAALLGHEPSEVMLVACHPSDLAAAAKCGLKTCYVSRPLEYGAGRIVEPTPEQGRFDFMMEDLVDLAAHAGC
jgi:2-haloacid dehalogenase